MFSILDKITGVLDWIFTAIVSPVFTTIGQGLELVLLKPLDLLNIPVALQTIFIAALTGCLSLAIRKLVEVEKHEGLFRKKFQEKRTSQKNIDLLSDWKTRDALYRTTDNDIDADFNTYLAQRFARHTAVYLLPIFLVSFWLENAFPKGQLQQLTGGPYALALPENGYGIEGLSVSVLFLAAYVGSLIFLFNVGKRMTARRSSKSLTS